MVAIIKGARLPEGGGGRAHRGSILISGPASPSTVRMDDDAA
ncbi:hypothetical protein [Kozakia baliensis]|nr:hypothetical protein [Kozakia baliensis]